MPNPDLDSSPILPEGPITPIPERHSASTFNFDYQLHQGKIYIRTRTPDDPKTMARGDLVSIKNTPDALEWKLFDGVGEPYNEKMESLLEPDEQIVEIDVASDIVVAVSNLNYVYLYKPTEFARPVSWESRVGAPDFLRRKLHLPENRIGWAFSCSVCTKPDVRTTEFMHPNEVVKYFSDTNHEGVNFDFGFTPTIYVLHDDGKRVLYWDTGLPPSFSRGFLVPEGTRGLFISAAGSTVFLCAKDSENKLHFFTRMIDYEINGACPGLKVSYSDLPLVFPPEGPDGSFFLGQGIRKMPLNGWVKVQVGDIHANLGHKLCIRLTGQGDNARELRIQGKDPVLGWGYYSKEIADAEWTFNPNLALTPNDTDRADANEILFNTPLPEIKKSYTGFFYERKVTLEKISDISFKLTDFHPFITDADAVYMVLCKGRSIQYIRIYVVDAWGLHFHKNDAELFGTVDGEPKPLIGTIVLTSEQRQWIENEKSDLAVFIKKHILPFDGKTKAITLMADNRMVTARFGHNKCRFKRSLSEEEINDSFYMKKAMAPQLVITPQSLNECRDLLSQNKECLKSIKSIFSNRKFKSKQDTLIHLNARIIRPAVSGVFKVANLSDDPTYEQAVHDLGGLFKAHTRAAAYAVRKGKTNKPGYMQAIINLKQRIEDLEMMKDDFKKNISP